MQVQATVNVAHGLGSMRPIMVLANAWRTLWADRRVSYRPEKHYMRGPGPKWREKHAQGRNAAERQGFSAA
jgi:hypothetical protein